ncbi:MAG: hypothetical protein WAJ99_15350 [Candidatus Sulfotelmatobacter sp.]
MTIFVRRVMRHFAENQWLLWLVETRAAWWYAAICRNRPAAIVGGLFPATFVLRFLGHPFSWRCVFWALCFLVRPRHLYRSAGASEVLKRA